VFSVASEETEPRGIAFNPDGTKMFVVGQTGDDVNEYHLTTPFDVSTASYDSIFSVAGQELTAEDVQFSPDGIKMFILGSTGDDVNQYHLATPFDVSTASFVSLFSVSAEELTSVGLAFNPDGTKMFVLGSTGDDVNEYHLEAAFDLASA
jgi:DNA-binding beta-propeller fold protein YncE